MNRQKNNLMKYFPLIVSVAVLLAQASAQDLSEISAMASVTQDLKAAQRQLVSQREVIASEKIELAGRFEKIRAELMEKRRVARISRMAQVDRDAMLKELEKKHYRYSQDHVFVDGQLKDYGLAFETFLLPGEEDLYPEAIHGVHLPDGAEGSPRDRLQKRLAILEAGIGRLEKLLGGCRVKAEAVAPDGEVKRGTFAMAGPAVWFVSEDGALAGAVVREKGTRSPRVRPGDREAIQTVIAGGEAPLSIDVTGGKALALASLESDRLDIFRKGGFWIWPILGIALVSAIAGVLKLIQIVRIRTPQNNWVAGILELVRAGDLESAKAKAEQAIHPVGRVVSQCLDYVKAGPDVVEEVL
jgi:hypothetical protein